MHPSRAAQYCAILCTVRLFQPTTQMEQVPNVKQGAGSKHHLLLRLSKVWCATLFEPEPSSSPCLPLASPLSLAYPLVAYPIRSLQQGPLYAAPHLPPLPPPPPTPLGVQASARKYFDSGEWMLAKEGKPVPDGCFPGGAPVVGVLAAASNYPCGHV